MTTWIQEFMTKDIGYGLQGYELLMIGGVAFIVGVLGRLAYQYYRGNSHHADHR